MADAREGGGKGGHENRALPPSGSPITIQEFTSSVYHVANEERQSSAPNPLFAGKEKALRRVPSG